MQSWETNFDNQVPANTLNMFFSVTDAGSENTSCARRILQHIRPIPRVVFMGQFCLLHQMHLIAKTMLKILDKWKWNMRAHDAGIGYFSGVACIANMWRATGNRFKILKAARNELGDGIASVCFKVVPGRVLRGRWLAIDSVEAIINNASDHIGVVFSKIWGGGGDDEGDDNPGNQLVDLRVIEDDLWGQRQKSMKQISVAVTKSPAFRALMHLSAAAKKPIAVFGYWVQKAVAKHRKMESDCRREHKAYLGKTPLSELVTEKSKAIRSMMCDLLGGDADSFAPVWNTLPPDLVPDCLRLIVQLSLAQIASWDFRFSKR